jgi:hypothetical protein
MPIVRGESPARAAVRSPAPPSRAHRENDPLLPAAANEPPSSNPYFCLRAFQGPRRGLKGTGQPGAAQAAKGQPESRAGRRGSGRPPPKPRGRCCCAQPSASSTREAKGEAWEVYSLFAVSAEGRGVRARGAPGASSRGRAPCGAAGGRRPRGRRRGARRVSGPASSPIGVLDKSGGRSRFCVPKFFRGGGRARRRRPRAGARAAGRRAPRPRQWLPNTGRRPGRAPAKPPGASARARGAAPSAAPRGSGPLTRPTWRRWSGQT